MEIEEEGLVVDYNKLAEVPGHLPNEVWIWDETLRDGEQAPGVFLTADEKIEIAKILDEIGVAIIAVGFPIVSKSEREAVKCIACENLRASIAAPARVIREDIDACIACDVDEIPIFVASSDLHLRYKLRMSREQVVERIKDSVQYAKDHGVTVDFIAEDSTRSDYAFLMEVYKSAIETGADRICICDTVGFLSPLSVRYLVSRIRDEVWKKKKIPISIHCHDDFGLATANTLVAVEEGVTYPHTCINGYGERAGNAPLDEVVMSLEALYNVKTHVKTEKLYELSCLAEKYFTIPIAANKSIVGENAFAHESGIHVHGEIAHPFMYESIPPEAVGRENKFIIGKFSGKHAVKMRLEEKGIIANDVEINVIVEKIKDSFTLEKKKEMMDKFLLVKGSMEKLHRGISEEDFWKIVDSTLSIDR